VTTITAPEHVFAGEKVTLVAHYEPAGDPASVRFELRLAGAKDPFEAAKVAATSSPARHEWIVALPKGTAHPTAVEFTATLEGQAGTQTSRRIQVHRPARRAIWAAHVLAIKGVIEGLIDATMVPQSGFSYLDDISSITGIRNQAADPLAVEWDPRVPNGLGGNDVARRARFQEVLDYAHARFIDVLVGFEAVDTGTTPSRESTNFMAFVRKAVELDDQKHEQLVTNEHGEQECVPKPAVIQRFVDAIVAFMFTDPATKLPWDGISFDLEIGALGPRYRPVIRELFHRLHDHPQMKGKWLAYATFGYTDRLKGRNGAAVSHAFAKVQLFELARGKPNMIARPMLYEDVIDEPYLRQVIEYAYKPADQGGAGLQRHQLQLGLQGDLQPGQAPRPAKLTDDTEVIPLITDVFRPACTGLVYFMLFNDKQKDTSRMKFFARIDEAYVRGT
jgi:hypothetical protein